MNRATLLSDACTDVTLRNRYPYGCLKQVSFRGVLWSVGRCSGGVQDVFRLVTFISEPGWGWGCRMVGVFGSINQCVGL